MGLNSTTIRKQYLSVSCGVLKGKQDGKEISGNSFTGHLLNIERFEDEYEGKQLWKIRLKMKDETEDHETIITFVEEGWYAVGFFARLPNVNLDKPLTVGVMPSEKNEKISFAWLKQGAEKITPSPSAVKPIKKETKKGRTTEMVYDWTQTLEWFDEALDHAIKCIQTIYGKPGSSPPGSGSEGVKETPETDDDLPF